MKLPTSGYLHHITPQTEYPAADVLRRTMGLLFSLLSDDTVERIKSDIHANMPTDMYMRPVVESLLECIDIAIGDK